MKIIEQLMQSVRASYTRNTFNVKTPDQSVSQKLEYNLKITNLDAFERAQMHNIMRDSPADLCGHAGIGIDLFA